MSDATDWPATVNRILITGSRTWPEDDRVLPEQVAHLWLRFPLAVLVVGYDPKRKLPRGVDRIAYTLWRKFGGNVECHPADWDGPLKRGAGYARNQEMVDSGTDLCLAFILDGSPGASHCAQRAELAGIPTVRFIEPRL